MLSFIAIYFGVYLTEHVHSHYIGDLILKIDKKRNSAYKTEFLFYHLLQISLRIIDRGGA